MIFPSLPREHGLQVVNLDSLIPDYERRDVPIPFYIQSLYNLGGRQSELWRIRACPTCKSKLKREPKKGCHNKWHRRKPKGWQRQP